jgi:uncharacterized protein
VPTVVLDTNVIISAIVFGGKPRAVFERAIEGKITLAITHDILQEVRGVLQRKKFNFSKQALQAIVNELQSIAEVVAPAETINAVTQDPDDNKFLECAVAADASCIISGDAHLLSLKHYGDIAILTPAEFLSSLP